MTGHGGDAPQATATAATAPGAALLGAALVAVLLAAGPTPAQSVRGTVTAADYDRPVTGALVLLVDTLSMAVDSTTAAARTMHEAIQREDAFQLDLDEMCAEPLRPWETGVLVGVSRHRRTMDPVPRAVVRVELLPSEAAGTPWRGRQVATGAGSFWFCNVPPGRARVVARAEGFAPDTSYATIRAGTISWYDALLRPPPAN